MRELMKSETYVDPSIRAWRTLVLGLAFVGAYSLVGAVPLFHVVETRFFPVMENGQWGEIVEERENGIVVSATALKSRPCGWRDTEFFIGERDGLFSIMPGARHLDKPQVRDTGETTWNRIFLPVSRGTFLSGLVFADSLHVCYGGDHLSRSRLFN